MQIKQRLNNLSKVLKASDAEETVRNRIDNMSSEELKERSNELTCKALSMTREELYSLSDKEIDDLDFDLYYLLTNMAEGKSFNEALQMVKKRNPDYRKETERYQLNV